MRLSATLSLLSSDGVRDMLVKFGAEHWETEIARIRRQSLCSGMGVVYDLSMFGEEWSPLYFHTSDEPIGWVNSSTGERVEGERHPTDRP